MFCKATLEKLGKAAYNNLSPADKLKYTTASGIVGIVIQAASTGSVPLAVAAITKEAAGLGEVLAKAALVALAKDLGYGGGDISGAVGFLVSYLNTRLATLLDQIKHTLATKLAVLLGVDENPGVLGAIMEWVYKAIIKPFISGETPYETV